MLIDRLRAFFAVREKVDFLHRTGTDHICIRVYGLAGESGISPETVRESLESFAKRGVLSLSTWRNVPYREVNWREWQSEDFFYNRDDANYVRLRLAA